QVQNWGDAVFASITNTLYTLLGAIPLIIGALVILIIGWLLSNALAGLTGRGLKAAGADRLLATHGADVYGDTIQRWPASRIGAAQLTQQWYESSRQTARTIATRASEVAPPSTAAPARQSRSASGSLSVASVERTNPES